MIKYFKSKQILLFFLIIFFIDLLSFLSHNSIILTFFCFLILLIVYTYLTFKNLYYGLIILLTELTVGSFGYLFNIKIFDFNLSIRLAFFVIFFIIWGIDNLRYKKIINRSKSCLITKWLSIFFILFIFGLITGILNDNNINLIFSDSNGYLYTLLIFAVPAIFNKLADIKLLYNSLLAGVTFFSIKTLMLFYFFSHGFQFLNRALYLWIRDARIGEITLVSTDYTFQRIFLQSQIYEAIGIFIIAFILYEKIKNNEIKTKSFRNFTLLLIVMLSTVLISFSRSFWFGIVFGLFVFIMILVFEFVNKQITIKKLLVTISYYLGIGISSFVLVVALIYFPIPTPGTFDFLLVKQRISDVNEAAVSSRWNLLPLLIDKIQESIFLGSGFGTTVTYNSNDPRIKTELNPTGLYTTSSFEWGFLDLVTEVGVFGALIYLIFYFKLVHRHYFYYKKNVLNKHIFAGTFVGLLSLFIINYFTPYLNHPLGIGFIIFSYYIYVNQTQFTLNK